MHSEVSRDSTAKEQLAAKELIVGPGPARDIVMRRDGQARMIIVIRHHAIEQAEAVQLKPRLRLHRGLSSQLLLTFCTHYVIVNL